jgi:hypothetical protein
LRSRQKITAAITITPRHRGKSHSCINGKIGAIKRLLMPLEPPDQLHLQGADGFKEW